MTRAHMPGRRVVPGAWKPDGARPVLHPHLHRVTLTQLDDDTAFPIERAIAPPLAPRSRPADPMKRKRLSIAAATAAAALVAFGVLLLCSAHQAHAAPATVWVGSR